MQRYRFRLPQEEWGSTVSKYTPSDGRVGVDDFTANSKNFETEIDGTLAKRRGDINYELASQSGTLKDLYEAVFTDGTHHLLRLRSGTLEYSSGNGVFNFVTSGYSPIGNFEFATSFDRVYFGNGIDNPQVYDKNTTYGGVVYPAPATKDMGAQAPTSAPVAAVGAAGNVPAGTYQYKVTFLYYGFEESNGGLASNVVTPIVASMINLTAVPLGGYGVTDRKIYRTDDGGLSYRLVGTITDNTTTIFTDNQAVATAFIPVDNGGPRNFSLIVAHKDRLWAAGIAGDPSELDFTAAGLPDIWPVTNTVFCEAGDPIKALVVYNDRVIVLNQNSFGQILGNSPDTYFYSRFSGRVGCVDNRTVQVRVIRGVPILVWLGDKKFYAFNGSSVEVISDDIEDLLNLNIQQAASTRGSNSQSSQLQFQAGFFVPNGGIDLLINPGTITTPNPKYTDDTQADWEAGSTTANIVTQRTDIPNELTMARQNTFPRSTGMLSGAILNGGNLELPVFGDFSGVIRGAGSTTKTSTFGGIDGFRQDFVYRRTYPRGGTVSQISCQFKNDQANPANVRFKIYQDSGGLPVGVVYTSSTFVVPAGTIADLSTGLSVNLSPGITYYIGLYTEVQSGVGPTITPGKTVDPSLNASCYSRHNENGTFRNAMAINVNVTIGFVFTQSISSSAGTWTSVVHDTGLFPQGSAIATTVNHSASYPAGTGATTSVDEADDLAFTTGITTLATSNLNGSTVLNFTPTKRFWRVRINLTATDDRVTPSITTDPFLRWPTSVTWISQSIDNTLGISALNDLIVNVPTLPALTAISATIQKSTLVGGPFTDEGTFPLVVGLNTIPLASVTNPLQRFTRVKFIFTNSGAPTLAPTISSSTLTWTILTNFYSQVIDTGAVPAGWDIFQANSTPNGGLVSYSIRSATTAIQLTDDVPNGPFVPAFTPVTSGLIPAIPVNQFVQWAVQIQSGPDQVPVVDSVTVNWFVDLVNSIRPSSIFFDQEYYVSLATFNSLVNNIILKFDRDGKWRVWQGQTVAVFSYFFADPFYADGSIAIVRKFLQNVTDHGNNIELDVRLKAFDFEDQTKFKNLRQVFVIFDNTGATYDVSYSLDEGNTFQPLVDATGLTTFTLPVNNGTTSKRFVPFSAYANQGKTILVRIHEISAFTARIHEVQIDAYVRQGDIING
ncbi:MAG: hypothetical protein AB7V39_00500 [Nitrospiraceae bacterium]